MSMPPSGDDASTAASSDPSAPIPQGEVRMMLSSPMGMCPSECGAPPPVAPSPFLVPVQTEGGATAASAALGSTLPGLHGREMLAFPTPGCAEARVMPPIAANGTAADPAATAGASSKMQPDPLHQNNGAALPPYLGSTPSPAGVETAAAVMPAAAACVVPAPLTAGEESIPPTTIPSTMCQPQPQAGTVCAKPEDELQQQHEASCNEYVARTMIDTISNSQWSAFLLLLELYPTTAQSYRDDRNQTILHYLAMYRPPPPPIILQTVMEICPGMERCGAAGGCLPLHRAVRTSALAFAGPPEEDTFHEMNINEGGDQATGDAAATSGGGGAEEKDEGEELRNAIAVVRTLVSSYPPGVFVTNMCQRNPLHLCCYFNGPPEVYECLIRAKPEIVKKTDRDGVLAHSMLWQRSVMEQGRVKRRVGKALSLLGSILDERSRETVKSGGRADGKWLDAMDGRWREQMANLLFGASYHHWAAREEGRQKAFRRRNGSKRQRTDGGGYDNDRVRDDDDDGMTDEDEAQPVGPVEGATLQQGTKDLLTDVWYKMTMMVMTYHHGSAPPELSDVSNLGVYDGEDVGSGLSLTTAEAHDVAVFERASEAAAAVVEAPTSGAASLSDDWNVPRCDNNGKRVPAMDDGASSSSLSRCDPRTKPKKRALPPSSTVSTDTSTPSRQNKDHLHAFKQRSNVRRRNDIVMADGRRWKPIHAFASTPVPVDALKLSIAYASIRGKASSSSSSLPSFLNELVRTDETNGFTPLHFATASTERCVMGEPTPDDDRDFSDEEDEEEEEDEEGEDNHVHDQQRGALDEQRMPITRWVDLTSPILVLLNADPSAAKVRDFMGRLPLHHAIVTGKEWTDDIKCLVRHSPPGALGMKDPVSKLYPFMGAAAAHAPTAPSSSLLSSGGCSLDTVLELVRACPELVGMGIPSSAGG